MNFFSRRRLFGIGVLLTGGIAVNVSWPSAADKLVDLNVGRLAKLIAEENKSSSPDLAGKTVVGSSYSRITYHMIALTTLAAVSRRCADRIVLQSGSGATTLGGAVNQSPASRSVPESPPGLQLYSTLCIKYPIHVARLIACLARRSASARSALLSEAAPESPASPAAGADLAEGAAVDSIVHSDSLAAVVSSQQLLTELALMAAAAGEPGRSGRLTTSGGELLVNPSIAARSPPSSPDHDAAASVGAAANTHSSLFMTESDCRTFISYVCAVLIAVAEPGAAAPRAASERSPLLASLESIGASALIALTTKSDGWRTHLPSLLAQLARAPGGQAAPVALGPVLCDLLLHELGARPCAASLANVANAAACAADAHRFHAEPDRFLGLLQAARAAPACEPLAAQAQWARALANATAGSSLGAAALRDLIVDQRWPVSHLASVLQRALAADSKQSSAAATHVRRATLAALGNVAQSSRRGALGAVLDTLPASTCNQVLSARGERSRVAAAEPEADPVTAWLFARVMAHVSRSVRGANALLAHLDVALLHRLLVDGHGSAPLPPPVARCVAETLANLSATPSLAARIWRPDEGAVDSVAAVRSVLAVADAGDPETRRHAARALANLVALPRSQRSLSLLGGYQFVHNCLEGWAQSIAEQQHHQQQHLVQNPFNGGESGAPVHNSQEWLTNLAAQADVQRALASLAAQRHLNPGASDGLLGNDDRPAYVDGVYLLHPQPSTDADDDEFNPRYSYDVVFLHGIDGDAFGTWVKGPTPSTPLIQTSLPSSPTPDISDAASAGQPEGSVVAPVPAVADEPSRPSMAADDDVAVAASSSAVVAAAATAVSPAPGDTDTDPSIMEVDDGSDTSVCWPRDWLPSDLRHARVLSVSYALTLSNWFGDDDEAFAERAREVADKLGAAGVGRRPVVFVAHSAGGLLVKEICKLGWSGMALQSSNSPNAPRDIVSPSPPADLMPQLNASSTNNDGSVAANAAAVVDFCPPSSSPSSSPTAESNAAVDPSPSTNYLLTCIARQTLGVVFYSTPHRGSELASQLSLLYPVARASTVVRELNPDSTELAELHRSFAEFCAARRPRPVSSLSFGEGVTCGVPNQYTCFQVVTNASANPQPELPEGPFHRFIPLSVNHRLVCKPSSRQDIRYRRVIDFIVNNISRAGLSP